MLKLIKSNKLFKTSIKSFSSTKNLVFPDEIIVNLKNHLNSDSKSQEEGITLHTSISWRSV